MKLLEVTIDNTEIKSIFDKHTVVHFKSGVNPVALTDLPPNVSAEKMEQLLKLVIPDEYYSALMIHMYGKSLVFTYNQWDQLNMVRDKITKRRLNRPKNDKIDLMTTSDFKKMVVDWVDATLNQDEEDSDFND